MNDRIETMKINVLYVIAALLLITGCQAACTSVAPAIAEPDPGASVAIAFTEVTWPAPLTLLPGWQQSAFLPGAAPVLTSTGGQGAALEVRSRSGDTLTGLGLSAAGNTRVSTGIKAFVFTASTGELISDVLDVRRGPGLQDLLLPLKAPHLMLPGEGLVIQLDADGAGYQVTAVRAEWSRP